MHHRDLCRVDGVAVDYGGLGKVTHCDDAVGSLESGPFQIVYALVDVLAASVEFQGMGMDDKRLAGDALGLDSCRSGHPVVGVDDIEIFVGGDMPGNQAVSDDFGHKIVAVAAGEVVLQFPCDDFGRNQFVAFEKRQVSLFRQVRPQGRQDFQYRNAFLQAQDLPDADSGPDAVCADKAQVPGFFVGIKTGQHEQDVGAMVRQSLGQAEACRAEAP